mmetsp:Transcript_153714/g.268861  ORF Transcript_153714/g.268861 Transcript_153714/m.268861 type:complete len:248 (-) Transcript_153714:135-878(-)
MCPCQPHPDQCPSLCRGHGCTYATRPRDAKRQHQSAGPAYGLVSSGSPVPAAGAVGGSGIDGAPRSHVRAARRALPRSEDRPLTVCVRSARPPGVPCLPPAVPGLGPRPQRLAALHQYHAHPLGVRPQRPLGPHLCCPGAPTPPPPPHLAPGRVRPPASTAHCLCRGLLHRAAHGAGAHPRRCGHHRGGCCAIHREPRSAPPPDSDPHKPWDHQHDGHAVCEHHPPPARVGGAVGPGTGVAVPRPDV